MKFLTVRNKDFHYSVMSGGEGLFSTRERAWCLDPVLRNGLVVMGKGEASSATEGSATSSPQSVTCKFHTEARLQPLPGEPPTQAVVQTVLTSLLRSTA